MALRIPRSLWEASKGWTTFASVVALYLTFSPELQEWGLSLFGNISPLWALVPVGFLFLLGLMRAPFEQYKRLEAERDQERAAKEALQQQLATEEQRAALKEVLAEAVREGRKLIESNPSEEEAGEWGGKIKHLLSLAFVDSSEAELFTSNEGLMPVSYGGETEVQT